MENALPLFALATVLAAGALVIRAAAAWWLRMKQLERAEGGPPEDAVLASVEARLARIEQTVEATAIEVERIAEAQRFAARLLAERTASANERPSAAAAGTQTVR